MNLLILVNSFPPEIKSASHLFYELSESLVDKGHKVTVVTGFPRHNVTSIEDRYRRKPFLREEMNNTQVLRLLSIPLPRKIPFARGVDHFLLALMYFLGGLFAGRQDAILVYSPPLPLGLAAYLLGKLKGIPFIFNVQDVYPQAAIDLGLLKSRFLIRLSEAMERFIYKKASQITVHSKGNKEYLIQKGVEPQKVSVVPNWVDTDLIKPGERMNSFREEHGLDEKFIVSFAGVMGFAQGLESVIEGANFLQSYGDILFLLVGDGVKKEELQRKAKALNLSNVIFLPTQPRERYPSILHASDVGLVTLKKEVATPVVPGKLLSIMASGRPVIASLPLDGDAPRIVVKAQCGYCVEPEKPEQLAEAILKLYNDRDLCEEMGRNGRRYAEGHLSRRVAVEKYERLFTRVLRPR